ncbi:unnamed protein product [Rotaria sp. Silwood2]|nr:unnamed protein product [Rotaria sp. Silwood2]CAF4230200.1 unnamed protein product [Rotaria sp. Silwood2]CAF4623485.1 unnamed protein product [Rotaria sp. Silwood2]
MFASEHRHYRLHNDGYEKNIHTYHLNDLNHLIQKYRKNDKTYKVKKQNDDGVVERESTVNEKATTTTNYSKPHGTNTSKRVPYSLEEMLQKKEKNNKKLQNPNFLTKRERETAALQRRQEEAEAIRQRNEELLKKHDTFNKEAERTAVKDDGGRDRHRHEEDDQID